MKNYSHLFFDCDGVILNSNDIKTLERHYEFEIDRYELPNILSLNFYIHGILEDGVSSNSRKDGQAKSLGEYIRAKKVKMPIEIMEDQVE